jgi:ribosomal protein S18 acetylase RimI-like enzyme
VAATLLSHAEIAIATQYPVAWLVVVAGNVRARRFYERQGWSDAGPVDYHAPIEGGTLVVPMRRYEKRVRSDAGRHPPIG